MDTNGTSVSHKTGAVKHGSLTVYLEVFMERFLLEPFVDWQVISSLLLGYQMLKGFPFCLAKAEKKAQSL